MAEITKDNSNKSIEINTIEKRDIRVISLVETSTSLLKKNKKIKHFLGIKRNSLKKISKKENKKRKNKIKFSINKQDNFEINKSNSNSNNNFINNEPCIICFEKISFHDKHFLHCGHCYHCNCINKWIELGNYECPLCKQDIECDKAFDNSISLEEDDEYELAFDINNYNFRNNEIATNRRNNKSILFLLMIYIGLLFFYLINTIKNNCVISLF